MSMISFWEFKEKYVYDCQLSEGAYGKVCRIQDKTTKKCFALKKISARKKEQLDDALKEIEFLVRFRNTFVVDIRDTYNVEIKNGFGKPIWEIGMVQELAKCSLHSFIRMRKSVGTITFIIEQLIGIIRVLFVMQKENIAHRDIKPDNILVFENPDSSYSWKLADFGLSVDLSEQKNSESFAGSYDYASPRLKRKFKFPALKLKTNPFKDDVYSLGVTLLEIITGHKHYSTTASEKLNENCEEKKLVTLIDMMLEEDEDKRPCFKQLMILLEKDFKSIVEFYEEGNNKRLQPQTQKVIKGEKNMHQNLQSDRTMVKTIESKTKQTMINTGKQIRCLMMLDGHIMCGCSNGEIFFVRGNDIISCGKVHEKLVSDFFTDDEGNIWSFGGDKIAKKWEKSNLLKALNNEVKETEIYKKKIFTQVFEKTIQTLDIESYSKSIDLPKEPNCGVSSFFAVDENHIAVGYFNGEVYIKWGDNEYKKDLFSKPVTSIKLSHSKQNIVLCSLDGQVKLVNTSSLKLYNKFYSKAEAQFCDMYLHYNGKEEIINLFTLDGREIVIDYHMEKVFENKIANQRIISSCKTKKKIYLLSENGEIIDSNSEKVINLENYGWNCVISVGDSEMVAGSFTGSLVIISL